MLKLVLLGLTILLAVLLIFLLAPSKKFNPVGLPTKDIKVSGHTVHVEIANTNKTRQIGLMNRDSMPAQNGMLFTFDREGIYTIWMKNTRIPLDIIWIDSAYKIVYIKENAQPCKNINCEIHAPTKKARYVLETNAGWVQKHGVALMDSVEI